MSFTEMHRRKQILDTAMEVIIQNGYKQTTIASVAEKAGVSNGVIFYYFKNKDELIEQINEILSEELHNYTDTRVLSQKTPEDRLKTYITSFLDFMRNNREKFMLLAELGINLNPHKTDKVFSNYKEARMRLTDRVNMEDTTYNFGGLSLDNLWVVTQAMLEGIGIQWISDPDSFNFDETRQMVIDMIDTYLKSAA